MLKHNATKYPVISPKVVVMGAGVFIDSSLVKTFIQEKRLSGRI
jgi:hypothetical protein